MTFNEIYLASLAPPNAALITHKYASLVEVGSPEYNPTAAKALLQDALVGGFPIDYAIQMLGWDPQMVMQVRQNDQYAWVPAYGQPNINIAPGLSMPGVPSNYTIVPPPGSIKVSLDPKDYSPFPVPTVAPPTPIAISVGPMELSGVGPDGKFHYYYGVVPGDKSRVGTNVTFDGQNYTKVSYVSQGMPGFTNTMVLWQLNLPS